ncbi:unnamed protein product [Ectocarpus sp. CCAP 1310/34]|nr:unnamed protein product [Ectocarpus sp. CCAP 1310/34]
MLLVGHEGSLARWLDVLLERDVEGAHALVSRILCEWNHLALDSDVRSALFDDAAQSLVQEGGWRKNVATKPRNDESLNLTRNCCPRLYLTVQCRMPVAVPLSWLSPATSTIFGEFRWV